MIRLGLCCLFRAVPIRFRQITATTCLRLPRSEQRSRIAMLCRENAKALLAAIDYCAAHGIGAFRVNSQILPLKTHPQAGYRMTDLPVSQELIECFRACDRRRRATGLRLSFHPDQFVLLNSPRPEVSAASLAELAYQTEVATWIGADVINIHGGGVYGDKTAALQRLLAALQRLPGPIKKRITLENDDRLYTPADLLPVCRSAGVPLVYDAHHHRCLPDGMTVEQATAAAVETWNREPLFHLSSPRNGRRHGSDPRPHHEFIRPGDFPACWKSMTLTVEIEAKAKELAVARLRKALQRNGVALRP